jgi:molecular chaperone DnaK (HSP70)
MQESDNTQSVQRASLAFFYYCRGLGIDILDRVQESRARLETEIRKLLHDVSRITEQALAQAKRVREEGAPADAR